MIKIENDGTNTVIGALIYPGIPWNLRTKPEPSLHLPGTLLPGNYRQPTESTMSFPSSTENATKFTICHQTLRLRQKGVIVDEINQFLTAEFIYLAPSAESAEPYIWLTAVKGLRISGNIYTAHINEELILSHRVQYTILWLLWSSLWYY